MHDFFVFMILAGIALIFKVIGGRGSGKDDTSAPPSTVSGAPNDSASAPRAPVLRAPAESEQERVRRFLEALGMPPGSTPPAPIQPRPGAPRRVVTPAKPQPRPKARRTWAQPLPPLVTTPKPEPAQPSILAAPEPLPPLSAPVVAPAPPILLPVVRPRPRPVAPAVFPPGSLGEMLRTPGSARRAIILREVLGPPRGLEPLGIAAPADARLG